MLNTENAQTRTFRHRPAQCLATLMLHVRTRVGALLEGPTTRSVLTQYISHLCRGCLVLLLGVASFFQQVACASSLPDGISSSSTGMTSSSSGDGTAAGSSASGGGDVGTMGEPVLSRFEVCRLVLEGANTCTADQVGASYCPACNAAGEQCWFQDTVDSTCNDSIARGGFNSVPQGVAESCAADLLLPGGACTSTMSAWCEAWSLGTPYPVFACSSACEAAGFFDGCFSTDPEWVCPLIGELYVCV